MMVDDVGARGDIFRFLRAISTHVPKRPHHPTRASNGDTFVDHPRIGLRLPK